MLYNCGGWCDTFFCIRDTRRAVVAIGMLTLGWPIIEIFTTIAVLTVYKGENPDFQVSFEDNEDNKKDKITYKLYIALAAADFILIIFSILLIYGNERTDEVRSRKFYLPWAIFLPFFVVYECAINIFYFYNQFNDRYNGPLSKGHKVGYEVIPFIYWIIKDILFIISFIFLTMRIRSLTPIIQYVHEVRDEGCGCSRPAPPISLPAPVSISTGGCGCGKSHSQPAYGYHGAISSGAKTGYTTNIYSR